MSMSMEQDSHLELLILQEQIVTLYTERNICVGIIAHMALDKGWGVGFLPKDQDDQKFCVLVVDFPNQQQICWDISYADRENIPLFHEIPEYTGGNVHECIRLGDSEQMPLLFP